MIFLKKKMISRTKSLLCILILTFVMNPWFTSQVDAENWGSPDAETIPPPTVLAIQPVPAPPPSSVAPKAPVPFVTTVGPKTEGPLFPPTPSAASKSPTKAAPTNLQFGADDLDWVKAAAENPTDSQRTTLAAQPMQALSTSAVDYKIPENTFENEDPKTETELNLDIETLTGRIRGIDVNSKWTSHTEDLAYMNKSIFPNILILAHLYQENLEAMYDVKDLFISASIKAHALIEAEDQADGDIEENELQLFLMNVIQISKLIAEKPPDPLEESLADKDMPPQEPAPQTNQPPTSSDFISTLQSTLESVVKTVMSASGADDPFISSLIDNMYSADRSFSEISDMANIIRDDIIPKIAENLKDNKKIVEELFPALITETASLAMGPNSKIAVAVRDFYDAIDGRKKGSTDLKKFPLIFSNIKIVKTNFAIMDAIWSQINDNWSRGGTDKREAEGHYKKAESEVSRLKYYLHEMDHKIENIQLTLDRIGQVRPVTGVQKVVYDYIAGLQTQAQVLRDQASLVSGKSYDGALKEIGDFRDKAISLFRELNAAIDPNLSIAVENARRTYYRKISVPSPEFESGEFF